MLRALLACIFIVAAGVLSWLSLAKDDFCIVCGDRMDVSSMAVNSFQGALIRDLAQAAKNKELPQMWDQILEVRYLYHSKKVQKSLDKSPIVSINKKGTKRLLVEFFDEPESDNIVMVRYNMVDIASGNTVSEMNRRIKLPAPPLPLNATSPTTPTNQPKK